MGPVALLGGIALLVFAPLMRGGYRWVALIPLELLGLLVLVALLLRQLLVAGAGDPRDRRAPLLAAMLLSPVILALVQLVPLPPAIWQSLPGHGLYARTLAELGLPTTGWHPVSVSPDATQASLLAGIPLAAAFLLGLCASIRQLKWLVRVLTVVALAEVALALLQVSGGEFSPFYFGALTYGAPVGTFLNRNLFANFLAMVLAAYVWLAYDAIRYKRRVQPGAPLGGFTQRHAAAAWATGALVIVVGIILSRSRAAALFGLASAALAFGLATWRIHGSSRALRIALPVTLVLLAGAVALVGLDPALERLAGDQLTSSAHFRNALMQTTFAAAWNYFPWGSGWGTYDLAYQQFQPGWLAAYVNHAHMDLAQMLFEGGALFLVLAACLAWLLAQRATALWRLALREDHLSREAMACALCGLGLLGFLLHSLVDFPMRVPANAILATLLAGVFLRPLPHDAST